MVLVYWLEGCSFIHSSKVKFKGEKKKTGVAGGVKSSAVLPENPKWIPSTYKATQNSQF